MPVKIQLVGRVSNREAGEGMAGPGDTTPEAWHGWSAHAEEGQGTPASTIPRRGHVLSQATSLWLEPGS